MWYYCHKDTGGKCDGMWRQHRPVECKGKAHTFAPKEMAALGMKAKPSKRKKVKDASNKEQRHLKLRKGLKAASTVIESEDNDSTSSDNN